MPNKHQQLLLPSDSLNSSISFPETNLLSFPRLKAADSFVWSLKSPMQSQRKGLGEKLGFPISLGGGRVSPEPLKSGILKQIKADFRKLPSEFTHNHCLILDSNCPLHQNHLLELGTANVWAATSLPPTREARHWRFSLSSQVI